MWDLDTTFSTRQTLTATTSQSENVVDAGQRDIGLGEAVYLQVALGKGGATALTVTVESSDNAGMTGAVDRVTYLVDAERVKAGGVVLAAPLPSGCDRYLRLSYSGASGAKITSGLVQAAQTPTLR